MLHMQNDANDPGGKGKRTRQTRETTSAMTPSRQRRVRESHFSGVVSLWVRDNGENDGGGSDDGDTGANWKLTTGKKSRKEAASEETGPWASVAWGQGPQWCPKRGNVDVVSMGQRVAIKGTQLFRCKNRDPVQKKKRCSSRGNGQQKREDAGCKRSIERYLARM